MSVSSSPALQLHHIAHLKHGAHTRLVTAFTGDVGVDRVRVAVLPHRTSRLISVVHAMLTKMSQLTASQWLIDFYPMGKTSIDSKYNIPGSY